MEDRTLTTAATAAVTVTDVYSQGARGYEGVTRQACRQYHDRCSLGEECTMTSCVSDEIYTEWRSAFRCIV